MNRCYLAVDMGVFSGHHILRRMENGKIKLRKIYRFSNGVKMMDDTLYWNFDGLFEKIKVGIRGCKGPDINPESMGIDTWAVDSVFLGRRGHVLGKTTGYRDRRIEGMDLKIYEQASREELFRRTGIQRQIFSTVYQLMVIKEEKLGILSRAEGLLTVSDYLNFLLIGAEKRGYTNATTTQLVNPSERTWDRKLIKTLGYPQKLFGGLSMPGIVMGRLSEDVRKKTGLGCRVVLPTTHDAGCAVAAVPSNRGHVLYVSSGMWSLIGAELKDADCRGVGMEADFTNEGGCGYRYRFLKNIMGLWTIQSVRKEWRESREDCSSGEICERAFRKTTSSIVDCNNSCSLIPEGMCGTVKAYCGGSGQQIPETKWKVAVVVCNNLTDCYCIYYREIQALTGVRYDCIHIVGGEADADYLSRLTTKAIGRTVHAEPTKATAIDNLTVQMIEGKESKSLEEVRDNTFRSFEIKAYESSEKVC